jgi:hypothetical protein
MGTHPKLSMHAGRDWGGSEQLGCYTDPMMVVWHNPVPDELLSFYINIAEDWDEMAQMEADNPPPYGVVVGMSAINKANHSGSGPVQIMVPNPAFDAPLMDDEGYWMGDFFVPYLRTCFQWGGFPGLRKMEAMSLPWKELEFLTDGLLAL